MADPLSLLRQYNVNKRDIVEKNNHICFGEYCWPKNVKTNYLVWGSTKDGPIKEYYTLECLLFLLQNVNLQHPVYVRQAAAEGVPVVRRPDRKDLLAYLTGESVASQSIDRSAPLELPITLNDLHAKFGKDDSDKAKAGGLNSSKLSSIASNEERIDAEEGHGDTTGVESKRFKLDNKHLNEAKKQFSDRLDAPKIKKSDLIDTTNAAHPGSGFVNLGGRLSSSSSAQATSLSEALSFEKIAVLKAKRMAKKRSTIIDAENEFDKESANAASNGANSGTSGSSLLTGPSSILFKYDADLTREIQSKERVWRNRSTLLQSSGKNFAKSIFPIIQTIKLREEGAANAARKNAAPTGATVSSSHAQQIDPSNNFQGSVAQKHFSLTPSVVNMNVNSLGMPNAIANQQQYNRYDQERFNRTAPSNEFRIDTTGSYHGFNLKNVTEMGPNNNLNDSLNSNGPIGGNYSNSHSSTPALSKVLSNIPSSIPSPLTQSGSSSLNKKRTSKTPIIIIPATTTSLINIHNAKAILQDLKYVDGKNEGVPRDNELLIQRRKSGEMTVPYRVIDNPLKLMDIDWERVVAVFVQGPAWQFKGWPWDGNPVEIFARIKAFHLKWEEMKLDSNVSKWNVQVIQLSRNKRHLDRANLLKFWSSLDAFMIKNKPFLRF